MMEPLSASHGRWITVIDLDGTLIRGNSLKLFAAYLLRKGKWQILPYLLLRKLRLITHWSMKKRIIMAGKSLEMGPFIDILLSHVRKDVLMMVHESEPVLSTAATGLYAQPFAQKIGIKMCQATDGPEENRGQVKKQRVQSLNRPIFRIITDHHDDLPLLSLPAEEKFLVNPSKRTFELCRKEKLEFKILTLL